jgi:hypothetical protein
MLLDVTWQGAWLKCGQSAVWKARSVAGEILKLKIEF